jgi:hypothetical protein
MSYIWNKIREYVSQILVIITRWPFWQGEGVRQLLLAGDPPAPVHSDDVIRIWLSLAPSLATHIHKDKYHRFICYNYTQIDTYKLYQYKARHQKATIYPVISVL